LLIHQVSEVEVGRDRVVVVGSVGL